MAIGELILLYALQSYDSSPGLANILFSPGLGLWLPGMDFSNQIFRSLVGQLYPKGDLSDDPV